MSTRALAIGMAMAAMLLPCARAQQSDGMQPGTPAGNSAAATTPQNTGGATGGVTAAKTDASSGVQVQPVASDPKREALAGSDGDLTFLPELKPTDGVASLGPEHGGTAQAESAAGVQAVRLDRAVAVIDGEVILQSDVREQQHFAVFEPLRVPGGQFTPLQAMQQIVNRTLLLHQMTEQQLVQPPSDKAVDQQIEEMRKHLPACAGQGCETPEGWHRFLAAQGFTEAGLHERWKARMQILNFIGIRFRTGIRIAKPEIEKYYREQLVPEFEARKLPPPALAKVSDRIDEVLLEQHVNVLLNDYLRSLKDAGNVQILDPAYNELGKTAPATSSTPAVLNPTGGEQ